MKKLICLLSISLLLTACGGSSSSEHPSSRSKSESETTQTNPVSQLSKQRKADQSGYLSVPEDYQDRDNGRQVKIHYAVYKAKHGASKGAIFFNFGGPGLEAVNELGEKVSNFADNPVSDTAQLLDEYDLVTLDPRGTGTSSYSKPKLFCDNSIEQACNQEFIDKYGRFVSTNTLVEDIEQLRQFLGYDRINYYGYSYGTSVGSAYAVKYGEHLRALVLDSPVYPNFDSLFRHYEEDLASMKRNLELRAGKQAVQMFETMKKQVQQNSELGANTSVQLDGQNLEFNPEAFDQFIYGLAHDLDHFEYTPETKANIVRFVNMPNQDNLDKLLEKYNAIEDKGGFDVSYVISCVDENDLGYSMQDKSDTITSWKTQYPLVYTFRQQDACYQLHNQSDAPTMSSDPLLPVSQAETVSLPNDLNVLIITQEQDTATPPVWGLEMVDAFGDHAQHLTVTKFTGHALGLGGFVAQEDNAILSYLSDPLSYSLFNRSKTVQPLQPHISDWK